MADRGHVISRDRVVRDRIVDARHDVFAVPIAPGAPRSPQELFAVAGRAAEIDLEHEIAVGREELTLEVEAVLVGRMWTAMVAHHERIRAGIATVVVRVKQPGLD